MSNKEKAQAAKAKGNTAFQANNYKEAIEHFTTAISHDATDHVFFSNRSACFASLEKYEKALEDGTECVKLKPDWAKGYTRKGLAQYFLKQYDDAAETYKAGLKLAPEDASLKEGLKKVMDAKYDVPGAGPGPSGGGGMGGGLGLQFDPSKLATAAARNPKIKEYMQDQKLMQTVNAVMSMGATNPQMQQQMIMGLMQQDPRALELIMAAQGIDMGSMNPDDFAEPPSASKASPEVKKAKKEEPPPPEDLRTPEQKQADEFKAEGNALYKGKKFEEALEKYSKAIEVMPDDITYYNNKCAVWIEMGEEYYDKVLETCQDLITRRYEINGANPGGASFEKVGKVFCRMASVHEKRKEFDAAIELYQKALTEDNNRTARNALRDLERAKEKWEKESYLDPVKAEEHREAGNEAFKKQDWAEAKRQYDEAVKRNPTDAKLYSNRAASLTKLLAYPDALRDLDECLKLDPTFIKAYSRKGAAHFYMKEYHKALEAYEKGLQADPGNDECTRGRDQVIAKISETSRSGQVDEEQVRHAMADPEIQNILRDPQINMFLKKMQEDPKEANVMMNKDVKIADAVSKLVAAGVLRLG
uniref:Hsp70-Hsp90 organising protein n=1 Tax=Noctiluca scintillans TaxID=2966 RepID=A0A7S1FC95_NOCSC